MTAAAVDDQGRIRALAWGGGAALILLPLFALKLADPSAWDVAELPFTLIMVAAVGIAFEFALRIPARLAYRAGVAAALGTALLLTWGNLAVGFAGSEDNRVNVVFFAVPLVALLGSALARFRARGIAVALAATAAAQLAAGLVALADGHFTGPLTVAFTGLWLASALLFRRSARGAEPAARAAGAA